MADPVAQTLIETIGALALGGAVYRLRGGWFSNINRRTAARLEAAGNTGWLYQVTSWLSRQRTQIMRLIWAAPTAAVFSYALDTSLIITLALVVSTFAGLAVLGHGAHMVHDAAEFIEKSKNKTELITQFWLPEAFGGIPDPTWPHWKVSAYNIIGMSWIGLVRNIITAAPLFFSGHVIAGGMYAASGLLHGACYWLGYRINGKGETAEVVVGAVSWAIIINL